jgi:hypothetical protein
VKTVLLATEKGWTSVKHLVDRGQVEVYSTPTFQALQDHYNWIRSGQITGDVLALDSITDFATTVRQALVGDKAAPNGDLWGSRMQLRATQAQWGDMSDIVIRLLRMIRGLTDETMSEGKIVPSRWKATVFICQDRQGIEDPMFPGASKKRGPDLNAMLLRDVVQYADIIGRLSIAPTMGELPGAGVLDEPTVYPKDTRILRLRPTDEIVAGARAWEGIQIPEQLPNPTLDKLFDIYKGDLPPSILIYGPPKVGKTTLACSLTKSKEIAHAQVPV